MVDGLISWSWNGKIVRENISLRRSQQEHRVVHVPGRLDDLHRHRLNLMAHRLLRPPLHHRNRMDHRQSLPFHRNPKPLILFPLLVS